MDTLKTESFTPQPRQYYVHCIVTGPDGSVLSVTGGLNAALAQVLKSRSEDTNPPVVRRQDPLQPLGQDLYDTTRDFVLASVGAFLDMTWPEAQSFVKVLPSVAKFTFVVSY